MLTTFSQDLIFTLGLHGKTIGSDVRNIPMPNESFTKILAHCAIDNFEGDADIGFIREAWRLLQPGGSVLTIPLHMAIRGLKMYATPLRRTLRQIWEQQKYTGHYLDLDSDVTMMLNTYGLVC